MIIDMNDWYNYIRNRRFTYSFGTKIHGNIMSILAGIPATVLAIDSRTREMAEFFHIPCVKYLPNHEYTLDEFYQIYNDMDYGQFNASYKQKFDAFESFLIKCGIVDRINDANCFMDIDEEKQFREYSPNKERFQEYMIKINREAPVFRIISRICRLRSFDS